MEDIRLLLHMKILEFLLHKVTLSSSLSNGIVFVETQHNESPVDECVDTNVSMSSSYSSTYNYGGFCCFCYIFFHSMHEWAICIYHMVSGVRIRWNAWSRRHGPSITIFSMLLLIAVVTCARVCFIRHSCMDNVSIVRGEPNAYPSSFL
jgi:hypothetical protein